MAVQLRTNRLIRHLLFWAGIVLFFGVMILVNPGFCFCNWIPPFGSLLFASLPTFLVYTYLLAYRVLPLVFGGKLIQFGLGLFLLNLISWFLYDLLSYVVFYVLTYWLPQKIAFQPDNWLFNSAFPGADYRATYLTAGIFVCLKLFRQWRQNVAESQRLEREKLIQELALLKLQLNPDLLFGTLKTLYTLTRQHDRQAPEVTLNLAYFLRYILYESRVKHVPLASETDVIEKYVYLQRIMHPNTVEISLAIRGNPADWTIPPLLLLLLVENAVQHLPSDLTSRPPDEPAWISIDLAIGETHLTLKVIHGQPVLAANNSKQLADIQKQLYFHYTDTYHLQIQSEEDAFIVVMTLPLGIDDKSDSVVKPLSPINHETTMPDR
ncbi:histidine kinase [Spirosoma sp. BT702]|uniref:Histidine kinase n=1 Tax=Spirosoma profusum TaxID=2771354 RepID=A0A927AR61_9BACT|nr:histidine kinase [Spirosoma profusum]MBD2701771.1 histidine kinase [Spirosoma profusum]